MTRAGSADSGTTSLQFVGGGAVPTSALHIRPVPYHVAAAFVRQHHYLGQATPGHKVSFGVFDSHEPLARLIGVAMWGRPLARLADDHATLQLYRFVILDCTEKNAESRALGYMARWLRESLPWVKSLLSYSDASMGHRGTIYKASGWINDGTSKGGFWSRPNLGRFNSEIGAGTDKERWRKTL